MKDFGFNISTPRGIDIDKIEISLYKKLIEKVPSAKRCILCGACSATCTASNHTGLSFRKCHLLFRYGRIENLFVELDKCMFCGKCKLVCPRGVNTRAMIYYMRSFLNDTRKTAIQQ
jgi:heterodisulfide reductase subunit C